VQRLCWPDLEAHPEVKSPVHLRLLRFAFFLLSAVLAGPLAAAQPPGEVSALRVWAGTYVYQLAGGATAGGVVVPATYRLTVKPEGPGPSATLEQTGNQVDRLVLCDADATASRLVVRFRSFADGRVVNAYGVAEFAAGETLFALQGVAGARRPQLKTSWKALRPDGAAASGTFFVRAVEGKTR
jgi:hypothetical protein